MPTERPQIKRAIVLAAGKGKRMLPLTENIPKPLIRVGGKTLIDHALDRLEAAGVEMAVVNLFHLPEMIRAHLKDRRSPEIVFSDETSGLLDTGGAVINVLDRFVDEPFFISNADVIMLDTGRPSLERMARHWDRQKMDALMLMASTPGIVGYRGRGDYFMDSMGLLTRRQNPLVAPFVYASTFIADARFFRNPPASPFSNNVLWDRAQAAARLFGLRHDGEWFLMDSVRELEAVEQAMAAVHRSSYP